MSPSCRFTATDIALYLVEVRDGDRETYIFEPDGTPLQYVVPPLVALFNRNSLSHRLVRSRAERKLESLKNSLSQCRWTGVDDPTEINMPPLRIRLLPLVHPEARTLQQGTANFRIGLHSAFGPLPDRVHVIRTMNVYHRRLFGDIEIVRGFRAVFESLRPGGLWILGRTTEEKNPVRNEVSVLQKHATGFRLLERLNGGSELEDVLRACGYLSQ
jgi:hypothetical protein